MLSNEQLQEFKNQLLARKEELASAKESSSVAEQSTELSQYDNHPADNATDLFDREKDMALDQHAEQELQKIDNSLKAIEEGTYGICAVSGKEIPIERLKAIPTALTRVEHANGQRASLDDRPSEEDVLNASTEAPYKAADGEIRDYEDSFSDVARYGTSETPSDRGGDENTYDEMYEDEDLTTVATDIGGNERRIYPDNK
ncbi:TraR/DksA C4-type zinc finger protein [Jeotgalibacillus soli]|uniref:Zinc finger DksA/TraR C4-type domain-containing protein n=1 Tax=Jeotgalibacillus soli TaxID=889306 RepID=A0A0C2RQD7_9BACL|nr:TraR/DksA C4-type zinc finger protein [Jeotgalibacillus soli]KIL43954.1 hypothetical protein KP78_37780 [Jeotgalibacillus soli]